jgi:hypothetical protein
LKAHGVSTDRAAQYALQILYVNIGSPIRATTNIQRMSKYRTSKMLPIIITNDPRFANC